MISPLKAIFFILTVAALIAAPVRGDSFNPQIRIKLDRFFPSGTLKVVISSSLPFTVSDSTGQIVVNAPSGTSYLVTDVKDENVSLTSTSVQSDLEDSQAGAGLSSQFFVVHPSPGCPLTITMSTPGSTPHHYRGDITVLPGLNIVDTLSLETYLKGVLSPEIGASAPEEALKAQAIASRTYAIKNLGKMGLSGADLDDTSHTQSYLGEDGETPAVDEAVSDTAGQILLYDGTLIDAVYSTNCGGVTGAGDASQPYLAPVQDPECGAAPPWQLNITQEQAASLMGAGFEPGSGEVNIAIAQSDVSGRVTELTLTSGALQSSISGILLRKKLGYDKLKSTLFKVSRQSDGSFQFIGQGWGHGLGLCQQGAIYLAEHDYLYQDILKHYYTGISIAQLDQTMIAPPPAQQMISSITTGSSRPVP